MAFKFVIFSHYGREDFSEWNGADVAGLPGVQHLASHFGELPTLLNAAGNEGMLVLFYAPGYARFLELLADPGSSNEEGDKKLAFARAVKAHIEGVIEGNDQLKDRVRFLVSDDLKVVLGKTNQIHAELFEQFFLGTGRDLRYDAPKVVEAVLRLRILGNGVPVFRLDHDVLFPGTGDPWPLDLVVALDRARDAYRLRLEHPTVSTFLFSARYKSEVVLNRPPKMGKFEAWGRAFATRIYPALVADPGKLLAIEQRERATGGPRKQEWEDYAESHVDEDLAGVFYGLTRNRQRLQTVGIKGLASIGAHPLYAVISGALLCLSDGAILDLPPYSNLGNNVMWIDDHLKYSLHRAIYHFTSGDTLSLQNGGLSHARIDVPVTKARPPAGNLLVYVFETYLPTLLWGAVFDAWITRDPILKCRFAELPDQSSRVQWKDAWSKQHLACLPAAMMETLNKGSFGPRSERQLRTKLREIAVERIQDVRRLWAELRTDGDDGKRTFACYWAEGKVEKVFGPGPFSTRDAQPWEPRGQCRDGLWKGIAPNRPLEEEITSVRDLGPDMAEGLRDLIDDAVNYVKLTLEWPKFVQIVRSIRQGSFTGDLTWGPVERESARADATHSGK